MSRNSHGRPNKCSSRTQEWEIRPAQPHDFDQLLSLFDAVAAERKWIGTEPGFDKKKYRARWQEIVDGGQGAHFVACHGSEVMGSLGIYRDANGEHELGMLVSRGRRRQGIGSALLRQAIDWAVKRHIPKLTLGVFPHNTAAIRLYEKVGFNTVQRLERKKIRQTGEAWDVVVMEKDLRRL